MGKNVYSLVLSDEVVEAIDVLATRQGFSRSALINHVLAQYASLQTPEHRMRQTIAATQSAADGAGFRGDVSSGGTLTLRTALKYKYNPALNYVVQLWDEDGQLGQLRVGLRSQNQILLDYFRQFFDLWCALENQHLPQPPPAGHSTVEEKRYARTLRKGEEKSTENTGEIIANYVQLMDGCMRIFFDNLDDFAKAQKETEQEYLRLLEICQDLTMI